MNIDLRQEPPTAGHIEAVRQEELSFQSLQWNEGSCLVLLVQTVVLGVAVSLLSLVLGNTIGRAELSFVSPAMVCGTAVACAFWWTGWRSMQKEVRASRWYVEDWLVPADETLLLAMDRYVRRKPLASAYVDKVRVQGRPVMAFEVRSMSKMSVDTLHGTSKTAGGRWNPEQVQQA